MDSRSGRLKIRGGSPDSKIISIQRERNISTKIRRKIVNIKKKKEGTEDGTLRNSVPQPEGPAGSRIKLN